MKITMTIGVLVLLALASLVAAGPAEDYCGALKTTCVPARRVARSTTGCEGYFCFILAATYSCTCLADAKCGMCVGVDDLEANACIPGNSKGPNGTVSICNARADGATGVSSARVCVYMHT